MVVRLVLGLVMTVAALAVSGRRAWWLYRLVRSGQPADDRTEQLGARLRAQVVEVFGQRKLLRWSVPGLAHLFTFWAFVILASVYLEAYGALFDPDFHIPLIGRWPLLGFLQDTIAVLALISLGVFAVIRIRNAPERMARASRFYGSHTGGAWLILFMIFNVLWTMFLFRGAASALGLLPYESGAWASIGVGNLLSGLPTGVLEVLESAGLLLHIGVMLAFTIIIVYSKHLHIFLAPVNVSAKRLPKALGPLEPIRHEGKPIDFEDPPEDAAFGRGKVEDFTWKGMLDFSTCTECGRCQSQCPAWNTGKPLSPKLVIMDLRDHLFAKAPYLIGGKDMPEEGAIDFAAAGADGHNGHHGVPESGFGRVHGSGPEQAARPLVGTLEQGGVIDPDVLWSCTTCGACVEQCPVDIEHVDHIVDMRRYQVMIESEFPSELGVLFRNLENKGNPWGQSARNRLDWTKDLPFEVPVFEGELAAETEYLFWVGCAGAFDDKAQKTVRATAELLHRAGVGYVVLGPEETCTGDPARRSGNEFVFQMLAAQNVEVLNTVFEGRDPGTRKIVTTCPHCFNTLGREYPQLDGHYEVVHHTQLLNTLVREGKLVPVAAPDRELDVDLSRPVLPGPAQRGLRRAARAGRRLRGEARRDAAARRPLVLLRRRRRPHVDGGEDRQAGQPRTRRRGPGHRSREDRDRVPVLPGHVLRRAHPAAERAAGHERGDPRRVAAPARRGQARRRRRADGRRRAGGRHRRGCPGGRDHSPVRHPGQRLRPVVGRHGGSRRRRVRGRRRHRRRGAQGREPEPDRSRRRPAPLTRAVHPTPRHSCPRRACRGRREAGTWRGVRRRRPRSGWVLPVDAVEEWSRAQQRVIDLVADLPPERADLRVPACPDWTVRDLLSHMVGLGVDVVAGDEPDDHNETWTGRQVDTRRDHDVARLVAEWQAVAGPLRDWMRANNVRPLGDVIIHEQDLRGALGVPGGHDTDGLRAIRERFIGRFAPRVENLPPIALVGDTFTWVSSGLGR